VAEFMTWIGHSPIYPATAVLGGMVLLLWLKRPTLAGIILLAAALRGFSVVLKAIVDRERPSPLVVNVTERLSDPSFPSGHVLGATLLYGFLIYAVEVAVPVLWVKRTCQAVLASMILLMGYARVELGAHWPTDVLAGWAVGAIVVLLLIKLHRTLEPQVH
jgi:undecaprenyl-diphosphatase